MENFYFTEIYNMHEIVIEYRIVLISCWDLHSALEVLAPLVFKRGGRGLNVWLLIFISHWAVM